jgi:ATP-dependent Clp protease ATP-binding subunit ClpC
MFERFTDRARKVMALADREAQRFNHEYVGTEHLLIALVKEGTGTAASVPRGLNGARSLPRFTLARRVCGTRLRG